MLNKLKNALVVLFIAHLVIGVIVILLLALTSPLVIGAGEFEQLARRLETFDFKWWLVGSTTVAWALPIILVLLYLWIRGTRREVDRLHDLLYRALDHAIPIEVDIDDRVPVQLEGKIDVPIEMSTKLDFDDWIDIEAQIPIKTELPLDTVIETSVLGIGTIKIPIRATIPLEVSLPVESRIHIKAHDIPIRLAEMAAVTMPAFEIPLKCKLETKIDLLGNLRHAEELIKARLGVLNARFPAK